jgi:hypothetical protein
MRINIAKINVAKSIAKRNIYIDITAGKIVGRGVF